MMPLRQTVFRILYSQDFFFYYHTFIPTRENMKRYRKEIGIIPQLHVEMRTFIKNYNNSKNINIIIIYWLESMARRRVENGNRYERRRICLYIGNILYRYTDRMNN